MNRDKKWLLERIENYIPMHDRTVGDVINGILEIAKKLDEPENERAKELKSEGGGGMKITKHKVDYKTKEKQGVVFSVPYDTKEDALKAIERNNTIEGNYLVAELGEEKEMELFCDYCERDLKVGDEYIFVDDYTRYCSDCYEENSFTYYTVCGEEVGDENDVRVFDEYYKEVRE